MESSYDVVIVGGGNAALCAALAAREAGSSVVVLERAPYEERGGNSTFTAGAMRFAYRGVEDILELSPDLSPEQIEQTDFGSYPEEQFFDDLARVTEHRADPDLADLLVRRSFDTLRWMRGKGVRFLPIYGRQAFKVDGRFKFWGGLTLEAWGGGPGLVDALTKAALDAGIEIRYETAATDLLTEDGRVTGVLTKRQGRFTEMAASAVVLASGGFQANSEWRTRYLGPGWDLAKVRGSRFNMGDGIRMALEIGAMPWGHWSGAHAVGWELNAPAFGDLKVGDAFQKHSYPFGIMVNARGERFVDEGADFRNYTYAKYGQVILRQPGHFAWQVFDQKVTHLLRDEYRIRQATKVTGRTLEELAAKLDGVDAEQFLRTIEEYNAAVRRDVPFDPNVKDGRSTNGLDVPKSNWANTIDEGPFEAYAVTCGITFTFGGLKITPDAEVLDVDQKVIPGLYACGELVGGIFYHNYPGGSGLTNGSVFGRIAGTGAGKTARAGS
ncbi:FAD-dependent tricarballylate dehydrogenase TcuA [Streptomyces sp. NPDC057376]|uniref:FAD-dependent tricarballylate dehydrogenase TcuA n=1 Tax=unclassified Streptomyces TaxID=2593676 RepID=UPI00093E06D8|nr:FAD-dependent tricarballylate dehydrogenase TcuA [Streptomyces sp. CB02414]OKI86194.1 tricarballylate dehydrogenase [Streptomyces sp. CB02414]